MSKLVSKLVSKVISKKTELIPYKFYKDSVLLQFDQKKHIYYLDNDGELTLVNGCTTVCKIIDKSNILIPWAVKITVEKILAGLDLSKSEDEIIEHILDCKSAHRERLEDAGAVGTQAHNLIEEWIKSMSGTSAAEVAEVWEKVKSSDERIQNCFKAAITWALNHNVRWVHTERKIYSKKHNYAGTLDGISIVDSCTNKKCCPNEFKDRLSLIDWKTSNGLYPEYVLQISAYCNAFQEESGETIEDRWIIQLSKEGEFYPWHLGMENYEDDLKTFLNALELTVNFKKLKDRLK